MESETDSALLFLILLNYYNILLSILHYSDEIEISSLQNR